MDQGGVTWIVTADAHEARFFTERVRAGDVKEMVEQRMTANDAELAASHKQKASVHARHGEGRHGAGDGALAHEAERRFLRRVATLLTVSAGRGEFDRLVLMAPPHALGVLRQLLSPTVTARLDVSDHHERVGDDAEAIRTHLRQARARTWS